MSISIDVNQFYIGWDVGGWNCDRNSKSRDAIVIMDQSRTIIGTPWRGNLRETINESENSEQFITELFELCQVEAPVSYTDITLAIDTPLGFSEAFTSLVTHRSAVDDIWSSQSNPYLYRRTEQFLFEYGLRPLSAVKDMIGSQATKGMHVLAKFAPDIISTGVWSDRQFLAAIEAYPSACKASVVIKKLLQPYIDCYVDTGEPGKTIWDGDVFTNDIYEEDERDALLCALIAWLYKNKPGALVQPEDDVSPEEGWIFVPADALQEETY